MNEEFIVVYLDTQVGRWSALTVLCCWFASAEVRLPHEGFRAMRGAVTHGNPTGEKVMVGWQGKVARVKTLTG